MAAADPGSLCGLVDASEPGGGAWPAEPITEAEMRVLRLLPTSLPLRGIGERLLVSLNTVKSHVRVLYRKLDVASREEAVARAREHGLI